MTRRLSIILALLTSTTFLSSVPAGAARSSTSVGTNAHTARSFVPGTINRTPVGGAPSGSRLRSLDPAREVVSQRTRTSKTYSDGNSYETLVYPGSVNYQDSSGRWQPIDSTLVASNKPGIAHTNKANRFSVDLPDDIGTGAVRVGMAGAWLEFSMTGAQGKGVVSGQTKTFANAFPKVDVAFTAANDEMKETLTLQGAPTISSYTYQLRMSPGLQARANASGGVDVVDSRGTIIFAIPHPYMADSSHLPSGVSHAVGLKLTPRAGGADLALTADPTWLANPGRKWPVVVDPTVTFYGTTQNPNQDCYILGVNGRDYSGCGLDSVLTGWDGANYVRRSLVQFDLSSIPSNSTVLSAELGMRLNWASSTTPQPVAMHQLTWRWVGGSTPGTGQREVNWNLYDGLNSWNTPGGDFASPAVWTTNVGPQVGFYTWQLTNLAQKWVNGQAANYGLLLKETDETVSNWVQYDSSFATDSTKWPYLKVRHYPSLGERGFYKLESHNLDDRMHLQVNVANGNLMVHAHDLGIRGTGLNLNIDRYFNNLCPYRWDFGICWTMSTGADVVLNPNDGDGATYYAPSGFAVHLIKNADGTYQRSPGLDATLTYSGGTYTITYDSSSEKYNFNSNGWLVSEVDRNSNTLNFAYNGTNALASITDTQGRVTTLQYNSGVDTNLISAMTDPAGRLFQYSYDANKNLRTYTDPALGVTKYDYDANSDLTQITDPKGNVTKIAYDTSIRFGYTYRVQSITYVTDTVHGTGPTTSFAYYTGMGSCSGTQVVGYTVVTDANQHATTHCYDINGRVLYVLDALQHSRQTGYNSNNSVASLSDGLSAVTQLTYDTNNNLASMQSPASASGQTPATTSFNYHAPGQTYQPSSTTDAQGNCRAFTYDSSGNLQDVYDGQSSSCDGGTSGAHSSNAYQGNSGVSCGAKNGELCWTTDPKGNRTTYSYDTNGNVTSVAPPAVSPPLSTTISYDGISRVATVTDGNSNRTTYSYDALDRIVQILYGGATTCVPHSQTCIAYQYDADGNLTGRSDNTGDYAFSYDALNRPTDEALPDTTTACTGSVPPGLTFSYDASGNMISYCDINGTTTYRYDAANRLQDLAEPTGSCTANPTVLCTSFSYDNNDRRTSTTFPGGGRLSVAYDNAGNETSAIGKNAAGSTITSFTYCYNTLVNGSCPTTSGNDRKLRQQMIQNDTIANLTTTYGYDAFNRLTDAVNSSNSLHYRYDANGNRCSTSTDCATPTYQYNPANEMTASQGVNTYTYDGNGNETGTSTGDSFTYNSKNQTTAITHGGTTLSGLSYADADQTQRNAAGPATFANSPLGVMIAKNGGNSTYYVRDSQGQVIGERTPDGSHWYFLKDGLGSVVAVVSGDGSQIGARYAYDPYGQVTCKPTPSSCSVSNPWQFAGGYVDATGLYKFGTRYYDPTLGRWTQQDPIGGTVANPSTVDRYTYAGDNPVNRADPTGADWWNPTTWNASCATGIGLVILGAGIAVGAAVLGGVVAGAAAGAFATVDLLEGIDLAVHLPWIFALIGGAGASGGLMAGIGTVLGLGSC